jgi:hypothetical protein
LYLVLENKKRCSMKTLNSNGCEKKGESATGKKWKEACSRKEKAILASLNFLLIHVCLSKLGTLNLYFITHKF